MIVPARLVAWLLGAALCLIAIGPTVQAQDIRTRATNQAVDAFFADFTAEWVRRDPGLATRTRYLRGEEQDRLERQLTPETLAWKRERIALAKSGLESLRRFIPAQMSEPERISAEIMQWQLQAVIDEEPFLGTIFPLEQFGGANVNLVNAIVVTHPLQTRRDAENYVAALGEVATRMAEAVVEARRQAAAGILPPKFILSSTIAQMRNFIAVAPAANPLVTTLAQRLDAKLATARPTPLPAESLSDLPDGFRIPLLARAEALVREQVYPAWQEAIGVLEEQSARATDDPGLWRLPNGPAAYDYYVRRHTTTSLSATEIHELGVRQVTAIDAQMDALLRRLGRTDGSVSERIRALKRDLAYPDPEDRGRGAIMNDVDEILRGAEQRARALFRQVPKAPVIARPFPKFREANAAANYTAPDDQGTRPGIFQIPLRPERMTRFGLRTLVYHETVPGHHFDVAQSVENKSLPAFRQIRAFGGIPARTEGWGLYAERLAAESGWYGDDIEGLLGQLDMEQFRARRLVVDTGLHAKHWTRQQAIDYGIEAAEVERYVVNPGQALSYMVGELKLLELRDRARAALGDRFALADFHQMVIDLGSIPLGLLERQTDAFIARERSRGVSLPKGGAWSG